METSIDNIRTRFAPSPTGMLHIGGLRTALYAFLFAKKNQGQFILRIEDTDFGRQTKGAEEVIYNTLHFAGLDYDEGPDIGGKYGPYIQSQRKEIYLKYAHELVKNKGGYYCFCNKQRLEDLKNNGNQKYDLHCRNLPYEESLERIKNEPYVIRQAIPQISGSESFEDMVFGKVSVDYNDMEDGILIKSDQMPTYNFANVVDDHLMKISHVIRGVEYLSSTPKYNLIYKSFGWTIPKYIHVQPIMRDATHKLSKRNGDASFQDLIKNGFLKEAILNYIALLGWSPKDNSEFLSLKELLQRFDILGISKSPSIYDENKLKWLNSEYIKIMTPDEFHKKATEYYKDLSYLDAIDTKYLSTLIQSRISTFAEIPQITSFIKDFNINLSLFNNDKKKTSTKDAKILLPKLINFLEKDIKDFNEELKLFSTNNNYTYKQVMWIFRIAITMQEVTPGGVHDMICLFSKEKIKNRMQEVVSILNKN